MVAPETTQMTTRLQTRVDSQDEKIETLTTQMKELSQSVHSMKEILTELPKSFEKMMTGYVKNTEKPPNSAFNGSSFRFVETNETFLDGGDTFPNNNHLDNTLFSMPKVKLPLFEGVDPRGWITKAELYFQPVYPASPKLLPSVNFPNFPNFRPIGLLVQQLIHIIFSIKIADLETKKKHLELEFHALEKEQDKESKTGLVKVGKELVDLRDELQPLMTKYNKDQERVDEILRLKEKRKEVLVAIQKANASCEGLISGQLEGVDKAIAELEGAMDKNVMNIGPDQIARAVSRRIGIPVRLGTTETEWLNGLAKRLNQKVVGQDEAVNAVTDAMKRSKVALGNAQKPICSFLFVGTTDGKIELAKALRANVR